MAIAMKFPPVEKTLRADKALNETTYWYDEAGVGWDIDYVAQFEALRSAISGALICPWDANYDKKRAECLDGVDSWPSAMAECLQVSDMQVCLAFAWKYDLSIAIREEGHLVEKSVPDGALVIDLSQL